MTATVTQFRGKPRGLGRCQECGALSSKAIVPRYQHRTTGLPGLVLVDSIERQRCTAGCAQESITVPALAKLIYTAAAYRAQQPPPLYRAEIAFLRKAVDLPPDMCADLLGITVDELRVAERMAWLPLQAERTLRVAAALACGDEDRQTVVAHLAGLVIGEREESYATLLLSFRDGEWGLAAS